MKPIKLDCKFQAHIILYCKGYYQQEDVDFFTGLRRIWAVRCGHDIEHIDTSYDEYIADNFYRILKELKPKRLEYLWEQIHRELGKNYLWQKDMTAIEKLINLYRSEIMNIQIREKVNKQYRTLIKLPKPQKRLFSKIVKGNFEYNDYDKVKY